MKRKSMHAHCFGHISGKFRVAFVWLILVTVVAGCTGSKGAGLYESLSHGEKKRVLDELKKNWQDYNIYCDGPVSAPGAVIFDPKNDDRNLVGYRYNKLSKEESVKTAIVWIEYQLDYNPSLYSIFDEEENFYGYVLIARDLPAPKRVDQKTLELPSFESTFFVP